MQVLDKMKQAWTRIISKVKVARDAMKIHVLGLRGSSTPGSDTRRMFMRLCLYCSLIYFVWAFVTFVWTIVTSAPTPPDYSVLVSVFAVAFIVASMLIFFQIVLLMPLNDNGEDFQLDARRLIYDTIISAFFMIVVFSVLYRNVGLLSGKDIVRPNALDAIYFSSVTFSTLGYGDFAPHPTTRVLAAIQALLGNLHLGIIVGATFAAIRSQDTS